MKTPASPHTDLLSSVLLAFKIDRARRRWRLAALVALGIMAIWGFSHNNRRAGEHVAVIQVTGLIDTTLPQQQTLHNIATNNKARALLVYIDSPGGSVGGGMDLFNSLRAIAAHKPVVAIMGTTAASAGYLTALGADYIVANEASITGSVGVLMPLVDATALADKLGIKSAEITSGRLKAVTHPLYRRNSADTAYLQQVVDDLNRQFLAKVKDRRHATAATMKIISDARMISGATAHALGLVDALGGYPQALAWLYSKGISKTLPELEYTLEEEGPWYQQALQGALVWPQDQLSRWLWGL